MSTLYYQRKDDYLVDNSELRGFSFDERVRKLQLDPVLLKNLSTIELEAISNELANYISTINRYRIDTDSYFSEPISLPNNISSGVGIFGAIGNRRTIKYRFPVEYSLIPGVE